MNLFVDTNVLLTFYALSEDDIEELGKLIALIDAKKINFITTSQIIDEFNRNRDVKLREGLQNLRDAVFKAKFPTFIKTYKEYDELRDLLKAANAKHSELLQAATNDAKNNTMAADSLITELFDKAEVIEITDHHYMAALKRMRCGNPPGKKKNSVGDEMNWEGLISKCPSEDIHIVSADSDYASALDSSLIHTFLALEWKKEKRNAFLIQSDVRIFQETLP